MKVILLENVPKVGQKNDVKEVPDGYGRNFLIKHGKAKIATSGEERKIQQDKQYKKVEQNIQHDLLVKNIKQLDEKEITLSVKANEKGHLFASVSGNDIVKAIKEQLEIDIPTDTMDTEPIKELGNHTLHAQTQGASASFTLKLSSTE